MNMTLRHIRITIVVTKKEEVLHILSVWSGACHPACKAHAPYYIVICGLSVSTIFFHIISKRNNLWEKVIQHKSLFRYSLTLLSKKFLTVRNIQ